MNNTFILNSTSLLSEQTLLVTQLQNFLREHISRYHYVVIIVVCSILAIMVSKNYLCRVKPRIAGFRTINILDSIIVLDCCMLLFLNPVFIKIVGV